jgi:excisionase family DNA binding protein
METQGQETNRLLNVTEVKRRLPLSRARLYQLLGSGELGSVQVGRRVMVPESDLEHFIESHRRQPVQPSNDDLDY